MKFSASTSEQLLLFDVNFQWPCLCQPRSVHPQMLICIERFLAVWFPHRFIKLLSRETVLMCVWVCVIPIVLVLGVMSILYSEITNGICHPNLEGIEYSSVLKRMPNTTVFSAIFVYLLISSMVILFVLKPLTTVKLYKRIAIRRQLTTQERNIGHFRTSVKLMVVLVANVTLVGLPAVMAVAIGLTGTKLEGNALSGATLGLLLNHSKNFLIYNIFDGDLRMKALNLVCFEI